MFLAKVEEDSGRPSCFSSHTRDDQRMETAGAMQGSVKSSHFGAIYTVFKSHLWYLLVGQPQASHLVNSSEPRERKKRNLPE